MTDRDRSSSVDPRPSMMTARPYSMRAILPDGSHLQPLFCGAHQQHYSAQVTNEAQLSSVAGWRKSCSARTGHFYQADKEGEPTGHGAGRVLIREEPHGL